MNSIFLANGAKEVTGEREHTWLVKCSLESAVSYYMDTIVGLFKLINK